MSSPASADATPVCWAHQSLVTASRQPTAMFLAGGGWLLTESLKVKFILEQVIESVGVLRAIAVVDLE